MSTTGSAAAPHTWIQVLVRCTPTRSGKIPFDGLVLLAAPHSIRKLSGLGTIVEHNVRVVHRPAWHVGAGHCSTRNHTHDHASYQEQQGVVVGQVRNGEGTSAVLTDLSSVKIRMGSRQVSVGLGRDTSRDFGVSLTLDLPGSNNLQSAGPCELGSQKTCRRYGWFRGRLKQNDP